MDIVSQMSEKADMFVCQVKKVLPQILVILDLALCSWLAKTLCDLTVPKYRQKDRP